MSESEYTLRQSLTSFYKYLTLLIIVYELLVTLTAINDKEIGTSLKIIFDALVSHSEALTILLPNYRE